ncbi:hypothetical protein LXL04_015703 [Taraxacum kok-saghyz]
MEKCDHKLHMISSNVLKTGPVNNLVVLLVRWFNWLDGSKKPNDIRPVPSMDEFKPLGVSIMLNNIFNSRNIHTSQYYRKEESGAKGSVTRKDGISSTRTGSWVVVTGSESVVGEKGADGESELPKKLKSLEKAARVDIFVDFEVSLSKAYISIYVLTLTFENLFVYKLGCYLLCICSSIVQLLLTAEQEAQQIVNAARTAKLARLKQAKEEAEREVAEFRAQMEADYQRKLSENCKLPVATSFRYALHLIAAYMLFVFLQPWRLLPAELVLLVPCFADVLGAFAVGL